MAPQLLALLGEAKKERARAGLRPVQGLGPRSRPGPPPVPGGEEQDLGSPPFTGGSWMGSLKRSFVWTALINAIKNTKKHQNTMGAGHSLFSGRLTAQDEGRAQTRGRGGPQPGCHFVSFWVWLGFAVYLGAFVGFLGFTGVCWALLGFSSPLLPRYHLQDGIRGRFYGALEAGNPPQHPPT